MPEAPEAPSEQKEQKEQKAPGAASDEECVRRVLQELLDRQTAALERAVHSCLDELADTVVRRMAGATPLATPAAGALRTPLSSTVDLDASCGGIFCRTDLQGCPGGAAAGEEFGGLGAACTDEARQLRRVGSNLSLDSMGFVKNRASNRQKDVFAFARNVEAVQPHTRNLGSHLAGTAMPSKVQQSLLSFFEWWDSFEEPMHNRRIDRLVNSAEFETACLFVIFLNMIQVAISTNAEARGEDLDQTHMWLWVMDQCFLLFYFMEIGLRLGASRIYFFVGEKWAWNLFDLFLVMLSLFGEIAGQAMSDWTFLRTLRILRVAKVIRAVRLVHRLGLEELMLMLRCIIGSFSQLVWCIVLICFVSFICSICFVQVLSVQIYHAKAIPPEEVDNVQTLFGSVGQAMLTLIQSTTGGHDWGETYEVLGLGSWHLQALFVFYVLFNAVSLWNVITSAFVEKALKLAQPSPDHLLDDAKQQERKTAVTLKHLFSKADKDSNGRLSLAEFLEFCGNPELLTVLRMLGVDVKEAQAFFKMLVEDAGSDLEHQEVDISTLVGCCLRIKGLATSIDLHTLRHELLEMRRDQGRMMKAMSRLSGHRQRRHTAHM